MTFLSELNHSAITRLAFAGAVSLIALAPLSAQAADLMNLRMKSDTDRQDIVLDLSSSAPDFKVIQTNPLDVRIKFNGTISPSFVAGSQAVQGVPGVKSVSWTQSGSTVELAIKRQTKTPLKVYALENPSRLVISVNKNAEAPITNVSETLRPGLIHKRMFKASSRGPLLVNVLEIDPSQPDLHIEPATASALIHGKARVSDMTYQNGAIAGVNASFFKPDTGTNLGALILNKELIAGPMYNRVCLGMTQNKTFQMARLYLDGKITLANGEQFAFQNVNQPRLSKSEAILYSSRWGSMSPKTPVEGLQIQIENNRITNISDQSLPIPINGYVLIAPAINVVNKMAMNDPAQISIFTRPDWSNIAYALSGGPYLVKNGSVFVDAAEERFRGTSFLKPAPRTAVGLTANNKLLMVTVDGRQNASVGVTLNEMGQIMRGLGAVQAMNLDGGSSTQMVVKGKIVNHPTVAGGARVSSSLIVRESSPSYAVAPIDKNIIGDDRTRRNVRSITN